MPKFTVSVIAEDSVGEQAQKELTTLVDWLICALRDIDEDASVDSESKELDNSMEFTITMDPFRK